MPGIKTLNLSLIVLQEIDWEILTLLRTHDVNSSGSLSVGPLTLGYFLDEDVCGERHIENFCQIGGQCIPGFNMSVVVR